MSAIPNGTSASSWMQRARAEETPVRQLGRDDSYAVNAPSRSHVDGWDPYEVWLSRIERPRRRRAIFKPHSRASPGSGGRCLPRPLARQHQLQSHGDLRW